MKITRWQASHWVVNCYPSINTNYRILQEKEMKEKILTHKIISLKVKNMAAKSKGSTHLKQKPLTGHSSEPVQTTPTSRIDPC
jgi:hypothetical protein